MAKETKTAAGAPPAAYDWSQHAKAGFEQVQREDLGIPFLVILQSLSPQIRKADPAYEQKKIEGAGEGDIILSLTNKIVHVHGRDPLKFIPCSYEKLYVEWKSRESGGGFVKAHKNAAILNECKRNERGQDILSSGNIIATTAYFYGLLVTDSDPIPCVIGMTSTQLKKAKQWLNLATGIEMQGPSGKFNPPMFSHVYLLSTQAESNSAGAWMGWKIVCGGQVSDPKLIEAAISTHRNAAAGQRAVLPPPPESDEVPI